MLADLARGSLHAGLSPDLCCACQGGLQASTRVPPMDAQGCYVPAQHGQQCLLSTMCQLLSIHFHHLSSPTLSSLQLRAISHSPAALCPTSHYVLPPILCHIPPPASSGGVLSPTMHHLLSPVIPHPFCLPPCPISRFVPLPTPCHHLLRTSSGHTHYPTSCPKPYWPGNAKGKKAANPKQCTKACSSPLEFPV